MVTNVMLMKFTPEGARHLKDAPMRVKGAIDSFEAMGGKVLAFYATTGEYDYIAIGEAPNDEVAFAFSMGLAAQGNVTSTTMRAYPLEQLTAVCDQLPA